MSRIGTWVQTVARYARIFSWRQLALFKLSDLLVGLVDRPTLQRARALRLFSYAVPPEDLTLEEGEYRFRYRVRDREVGLSLRKGSSDVQVFLQVLRYEEYGDVVRMLGESSAAPRILDVGANIGLATLFFQCHRPDARIVAMEPEPGSFERLRLCVDENRLDRVTLLNEGLWTHDTRLAADHGFRDGQSWAFALRESGPVRDDATIPVRSLGSVLDAVGWEDVDLLKIDIEGAEARLLRDPDFMATVGERVRLLCMEIHRETITRAEAQEALSSIGFRSVVGSETLVAWRRG